MAKASSTMSIFIVKAENPLYNPYDVYYQFGFSRGIIYSGTIQKTRYNYSAKLVLPLDVNNGVKQEMSKNYQTPRGAVKGVLLKFSKNSSSTDSKIIQKLPIIQIPDELTEKFMESSQFRKDCIQNYRAINENYEKTMKKLSHIEIAIGKIRGRVKAFEDEKATRLYDPNDKTFNSYIDTIFNSAVDIKGLLEDTKKLEEFLKSPCTDSPAFSEGCPLSH